MTTNKDRLEELRAILRDESISYGELAELADLAAYIHPSDVELLEAAGVPEFPEDDDELTEDVWDAIGQRDWERMGEVN